MHFYTGAKIPVRYNRLDPGEAVLIAESLSGYESFTLQISVWLFALMSLPMSLPIGH